MRRGRRNERERLLDEQRLHGRAMLRRAGAMRRVPVQEPFGERARDGVLRN